MNKKKFVTNHPDHNSIHHPEDYVVEGDGNDLYPYWLIILNILFRFLNLPKIKNSEFKLKGQIKIINMKLLTIALFLTATLAAKFDPYPETDCDYNSIEIDGKCISCPDTMTPDSLKKKCIEGSDF